MSKQQEATTEAIGSPIGTKILSAQVSKNGFKLKASGTNWELLNIAAALIDHVAVAQQTDHEDTIGAVIEILMQDEI